MKSRDGKTSRKLRKGSICNRYCLVKRVQHKEPFRLQSRLQERPVHMLNDAPSDGSDENVD